MKSDKDVAKLLYKLVQPHDNVITCAFGSVEGMPWAKPLPASFLAARAKNLTDGVVKDVWDKKELEDPQANVEAFEGDTKLWHDNTIVLAIQEAIRVASQEDVHDVRVCITGSLYLVGDVLRCVRDAGGYQSGFGQAGTRDPIGVKPVKGT